MNNFKLILLLLVSTSLFSCQDVIKGVGEIVPETRSLEPFDEIELNGMINATFRQIKSAEVDKVVVSAQENLLPYVKTRVEDGLLIIEIEESIKTDKDVIVEIYGGSFRSLVNTGSGDLKSDGKIKVQKLYVENNGSGDVFLELETKSLEAELNGSGDISFSGSTDYLEVESNGSGDFNSKEMRSFEVEIETNGSGDASFFVKESLDVEINGSGDVFYKGKPELSKSLNGTGSIKAAK